MELWRAKEIESKNFKSVARLHPRLFGMKNFLDSPNFLEKYGIFIPQKKKFPQGYLKLWPQDFIVEEISLDGELQTVFPDKFLHKERDFLPEDLIIYATLVKCGLSTIEAVEELTNALSLGPKETPLKLSKEVFPALQYIKYAGIKDKHAITSQLISIKSNDIEKLYQLSFLNFFVKNIFSGKKETYLGNLKGNQFTILIRTGSDFEQKGFLKKLKEIEEKGFFNFFYLQRFGIPRLINPYCGLYILKGNYEKAVFTAICKPGKRELFYFQSLRKEIEKLWGNWEEIEGILEQFPLTFQDERKLIGYLIKNPTDFVGALNQIPRVVQLWLTSFTALLFNKLLSFHLQKEGRPPTALPLILSQNEKSWLPYKELLNQAGIYSMTFALKNLQPFPHIVLRKREQKTIERVKILNQKIIPQGVILQFILPKGCYATTFLSQLFNLVSGNLPKSFSNLPIDTKANLGQPSLEEILNKFTDVVSSPSWRYLWGIH